MRPPGIGTGIWVGALLTSALVSLFYLGWKFAGLPFVPFDVFDGVTRLLPGRLLAFGIDTMVSVIRGLDLGPTASSAKMAEQTMAILGIFGAGVAAAVVYFGLLRVALGRFALPLAVLIALAWGTPAISISLRDGLTSGVSPGWGLLWELLVFLAWGSALGATGGRLTRPVSGETAGAFSVEGIDRRRFLIRLGGASAAITVVGAGVALSGTRGSRREEGDAGRWSSDHSLPNEDAAVRPVPGTRPEYTPLERHYRIDINTIPPVLRAEEWKLKIGGLVEEPMEFSLEDLRGFEPLHQFVTLSCISNPVGGDLIGTTRWTGVSLRRLLPLLGLKPDASHFKIRSADGFYEVVSLETIRSDERVMLAYDWDGVPLLPEHGFPLRIYIPDLYGMKQPKWIESMEATDQWEPGYWVTRGWDRMARMKATSVIDAIGVPGEDGAAGKTVSIGGMAHAGARGISRVEVQVDDGPWQDAFLRPPLSGTTWVLWRFEWPFQPGRHAFVVRCQEGNGIPQRAEKASPSPSGASGLHHRSGLF